MIYLVLFESFIQKVNAEIQTDGPVLWNVGIQTSAKLISKVPVHLLAFLIKQYFNEILVCTYSI